MLLAELVFVGGSDLEGYDEAMRTIAAEAARVTGRTPGERLVIACAHVMRGENPADPAGAARELLGRRLHRDFPGGFAVGSLTFSAVAHADQRGRARRRRARDGRPARGRRGTACSPT